MKICERWVLSRMADNLDSAVMKLETCIEHFGYFIGDRTPETFEGVKNRIEDVRKELNAAERGLIGWEKVK